jgi:hypothetical protein
LRSAGNIAGKRIIEISNPLKADMSGLAIGQTTSAAEEIAKAFSGAKVVKAFNTIFAQVLNEGADFRGGAAPWSSMPATTKKRNGRFGHSSKAWDSSRPTPGRFATPGT